MNDSLTVAIEGAECLARLVDRRGKFLYRYDADNPGPSTGYNILRHCGTIWAMTEIANRAGPLPKVAEAAQRATEWLIGRHIRPYGTTGTRCVVAGDAVKLGGNGLAILALLEVAALSGNQAYVELAGDLAGYIVLQRQPDGNFAHKRRFSTDEIQPFHSDYYTGEALFGLLRLTNVTGEQRWLDVTQASEDQLAAQDYGVTQQSHWMLYALEQLHKLRPQSVSRTHARTIAENILDKPEYRNHRRSTPIACRTEGLLAFVRLCEGLSSDIDGRPLFDRVAARARIAIHENLELQTAYRRSNGSFVHGLGNSEVRIDYIQHNISSFLGYSLLPGARPLVIAAAP
ncbi:MAG: hypothetical protein ACKVOI_06865 [Dongiaceae bacterium]